MNPVATAVPCQDTSLPAHFNFVRRHLCTGGGEIDAKWLPVVEMECSQGMGKIPQFSNSTVASNGKEIRQLSAAGVGVIVLIVPLLCCHLRSGQFPGALMLSIIIITTIVLSFNCLDIGI